MIGRQETHFLVDFFLSFSTSLLFVLELLSTIVLPMFAVALRTGGGGGGDDVSDSGGWCGRLDIGQSIVHPCSDNSELDVVVAYNLLAACCSHAQQSGTKQREAQPAA